MQRSSVLDNHNTAPKMSEVASTREHNRRLFLVMSDVGKKLLKKNKKKGGSVFIKRGKGGRILDIYLFTSSIAVRVISRCRFLCWHYLPAANHMASA